MTPEEGKILEMVVNSQEAVDIVKNEWDWSGLTVVVERELGRKLSEDEEDRLERDWRDWWKNGNFRVWGEDEEDPIFPGLTKWQFGEPDFWEENR